jgi:hypothetical protein
VPLDIVPCDISERVPLGEFPSVDYRHRGPSPETADDRLSIVSTGARIFLEFAISPQGSKEWSSHWYLNHEESVRVAWELEYGISPDLEQRLDEGRLDSIERGLKKGAGIVIGRTMRLAAEQAFLPQETAFPGKDYEFPLDDMTDGVRDGYRQPDPGSPFADEPHTESASESI